MGTITAYSTNPPGTILPNHGTTEITGTIGTTTHGTGIGITDTGVAIGTRPGATMAARIGQPRC